MPGLPCLRKLLLGRFLLVVRAGRSLKMSSAAAAPTSQSTVVAIRSAPTLCSWTRPVDEGVSPWFRRRPPIAGSSRESWETARMDPAAYAQAKGHFWWWQVQDSNLGRRSRRFYREPITYLPCGR